MPKEFDLNKDKFISSKDFRSLYQDIILDVLDLLLSTETPFKLKTQKSKVLFYPELPSILDERLNDLPVFNIKEDSFSSFHIIEPYCIFKIGFVGYKSPFEVKIKITDIAQILNETNIQLLSNITAFLDNKPDEELSSIDPEEEVDVEGINKSLFLFMTNEENQKFFKK